MLELVVWQRWIAPPALAVLLSAWPTEQDDTENVVFLTDLIDAKPLSDLLAMAFANNPSLQQTRITLQQRQAQLKQTKAARLPQVSAGLGASRTEDAADSFSSQIDISWQADLWGKLAVNCRATVRKNLTASIVSDSGRSLTGLRNHVCYNHHLDFYPQSADDSGRCR